LGNRATQRLHELVNLAPFTADAATDRDEDKCGRKLRVLTRDGQSLGGVLVQEGLARPWDGSRHPWC
jgi:micrococcal nuclease